MLTWRMIRAAAFLTAAMQVMLLGALLVRPAADGKVLVGDAGWNRYDARANIAWVDPQPERLRNEHLSRSPSGRYSVRSDERDERARLVIRDRATGSARAVAPGLRVPPYTRFLEPAWIPGTERMLVGVLTNDAPGAAARSLVMELDAATGDIRFPADLTARTGVVFSAPFSPGRGRAALLTYEGELFIWERATDTVIASLALSTPGFARWAGEDTVVVMQGPCLWVVDAVTGTYDEHACVQGLRRFDVSPDGEMIAAAWAVPREGGGVHLLDLHDSGRQQVIALNTPTPSGVAVPRQIAWSREGRYLYVAFDAAAFGDVKYLIDTRDMSVQRLPGALVEFLSWETDAQLACDVGRACG